MLRREVLPAPLGPMMERMRPLGISIDTSSTAVTPPNRLLTPATDSWTEAALISWDAGVKFISPPLTWRRADRHETDRRERDGADRLASKTPPRPHAATARLSLFAVIVLSARGPSGILEQPPRLRQGPSWWVPCGRWHARRNPALRPGYGRPQTRCTVSTTNCSFCHCSSSVRALPPATLAKPHWLDNPID